MYVHVKQVMFLNSFHKMIGINYQLNQLHVTPKAYIYKMTIIPPSLVIHLII